MSCRGAGRDGPGGRGEHLLAKLSWPTDGENGESVINDGGKLFETALGSRIPVAYGYDDKRKQRYTCGSPTNYQCYVG